MRTESALERRIRKYKDDPDYVLEGVLWDITEEVVRAMKRKGISRANLARKLHTTPANVTQLLRGKRNMTLRSLVRLAMALDGEVALGIHLRDELPTRRRQKQEQPFWLRYIGAWRRVSDVSSERSRRGMTMVEWSSLARPWTAEPTEEAYPEKVQFV